jgi:hypothetical protein
VTGHHTTKVVAQLGLLFVRRVKLEQDNADGWSAHVMIYRLESKAAYQRYFDSTALTKFPRERQPFAYHLKMERDSGASDVRIP